MIRALVLIFGWGLIVAAIALLVVAPRAWPASLELGLFGVAVVLTTVFEQWRYRKKLASGGTWQTTTERFRDPTSGVLTEVLYNPQTGQRDYRPVVESQPIE